MRSPFPGMDPYLESHWRDVHASLIITARGALNRVLPDDLAAAAEERVVIEDDSDEREFGPDVRVIIPDDSAVSNAGDSSVATIDAPVRVLAHVEPVKEKYLRIVEVGTGKLITIIEFLSPMNKRAGRTNGGLEDFRAKRRQFLNAGANFVEINLVRRGNWRALLRPHRCPTASVTTYRATVRLPAEPEAVYLYPLPLQQRLESVPIPLRRQDPEVRLQLQELVDVVYAEGRYGRRLDYSRPLEPPLAGENAAWVQKVMSKQ